MGSPQGHSGFGTICPTAAGRPTPAYLLAASTSVARCSRQQLFRHYVGASPKWVLARYRRHDAAERLECEPGVPIAAVAAAVGYFDQAHFGHEFKALLDVTPAEYAAHGRDALASER